MTRPESHNPFRNVRVTKPWVLDRIIHPPPRHFFHSHAPPLIPRLFSRRIIVQMPFFLLGTCMLLFLWQSNLFGVGFATGDSVDSRTTLSTASAPQIGIEPTPRLSPAPSTVAVRPSPTPLSQPKPAATRVPDQTTKYEVKAGDSLWVIAGKYGVSVDELRAANGLTSNLLRVGDVLVIPSKPK